MEPQIREALYTTLAPLHVKRWVFVGLHKSEILPIIHLSTVFPSIRVVSVGESRLTSGLGCCRQNSGIDLTYE